MKSTIIDIGNSKGIRIPKPVLEQCHLEKDIELIIKGDSLIITAYKNEVREGWDEAFQYMTKNGDDKMIIADSVDLDSEEWTW